MHHVIPALRDVTARKNVTYRKNAYGFLIELSTCVSSVIYHLKIINDVPSIPNGGERNLAARGLPKMTPKFDH
jgi:hypothetical protein